MPVRTEGRAPSMRAAMDRDRQIIKAPVTKAEMTERIAMRETPVHEVHLTPGGGVEQVVRQNIDARNERRIGFIRQRLARCKGRAREDFNRPR